jgi:hypothetical protein
LVEHRFVLFGCGAWQVLAKTSVLRDKSTGIAPKKFKSEAEKLKPSETALHRTEGDWYEKA